MKKVIATISAALLIIGLSGCAGNSSSAPDPTYTPTTEPEPTYTPPPAPKPTPKPKPTHVYTKDEIFISVVRDQYPYYASLYTNSELIKLGSLTCTYFRQGGDFESLAYSLVMNIDSSDPDFYSFIGFTIGAAVATYCPEYAYQVS